MRPLLLVRPRAQAAAQAARLAARGITALPFCVQDTVPDTAALAALPQQARHADWLVFVSPSCIALAWPALAAQPLAANLACVGQASAAQLSALSLRTVLYPAQGNDSDALLAEPVLQQLDGQCVLIVRGDGGRPQLGETLAARGATVRYAEVYRRVPATADWPLFERLCAGETRPALLLTSSDSARLLFAQASPSQQAQLQSCLLLALHPRIAATLAQLGARQVAIAADDDALLQQLAGV